MPEEGVFHPNSVTSIVGACFGDVPSRSAFHLISTDGCIFTSECLIYS